VKSTVTQSVHVAEFHKNFHEQNMLRVTWAYA